MSKIIDKHYNKLKAGLWVLGWALILFQYLVNRSMWTDEAKLALNIIELGFFDLAQPLNYYQSSPILFLWLAEFFSTIFGSSDFALRLAPLLLGMASIPVFSQVASLLFKSKFWSLVSILMFIMNISVIYYSSEFKQYIGDVFVLVTLILLAYSDYKKGTRNRYLLLGVLGPVFLFLSNITSILFVVTGLILIEQLYARSAVTKMEIKQLIMLFVTWLIAIIIFYFSVIYHNPLKESMREFWSFSFPPKPFYSLKFLSWIGDYVFAQLQGALNLPRVMFYSLLILSVTGSVVKRNWRLLFLTFSPILIHIILAYLNIYPFYKRLIIYAVPLFILLFVGGLQDLSSLLKSNPKTRAIFMVIVLGSSFLVLFAVALKKLPIQTEELKPAIQTVVRYQEPNDLVYVYYGSAFSFRRYQSYYKLDNYILGNVHRDQNQEYLDELDSLLVKNDRVWFVFSHLYPWGGGTPEDVIMSDYLLSKGSLSHDKRFNGSRVFLYKKNSKN